LRPLFGVPRCPRQSQRRTTRRPATRSTSSQRSARSSPMRSPVRSAKVNIGRHSGSAASRNRSASPAELPGARPRWRRRDHSRDSFGRIHNQSPRPPCRARSLSIGGSGRKDVSAPFRRLRLFLPAKSLIAADCGRGAPPRRAGRGRLQDVRCPCLREGQRLQSNGCAGIRVRRVFLTLGCHHSVWVAAAPWGNDFGSDSAALEH